ncbi:MAG: CoA-acylating methylmalonate-semialdehyde dehydrogenase [Lentimicrobiaceae bacterium]|jgi:malonate-semialdehyde dehydrogenase (acetylating)/methylmalonate-semialdehyde dehydrogenase
MKYPEVKNYINGQFVPCDNKRIDVDSPLTGKVISTVPLSTYSDVDAAAKAAKDAFPAWSGMTSKMRSQILYTYRQIIEQNVENLAAIIHEENGKTIDEAMAEVRKSIELTEFACSVPQIAVGDVLEVSVGVECRTEYAPLGVVACINPFNFPHMVPHWTVPNALALGNCIILKPSELAPITAMKMAEMLKQAGLPDGVFNIVNGAKDVVEAICDHPEIKAVSFVGSTPVAQIVYRRATSNLKRCLALGGAKNHLIVLPDANLELSASDIAASMCGSAGQRCMAASVMIAVGNVNPVIEKLCTEVTKFVPGSKMPPIISRQSRENLINYIDEAENKGAKLLVDGRKISNDSTADPNGYYLGPTIIDWRESGAKMPDKEVFGPVFEIISAKSVEEAISIQHESPFGNAASAFTQNGAIARMVAQNASAGMIGINIGVPVPREPFSFGGWNASKFGAGDITGNSSLGFWSQLKKVTSKWAKQEITDWMS